MTPPRLSATDSALYVGALGELAQRGVVNLVAGVLDMVRHDLNLDDDPEAYAAMRRRLVQIGATEAALANTAFADPPTPWNDETGVDPMEPER